MIEQKLMSIGFRKGIIEEIIASENIERMDESSKSCDVYNGEMYQYVESYLKEKFGADSASQMPIVSSINLAKKIINTKATVYRNEPQRTFTDVSEDMSDSLNQLYDKIQFDSKMMIANRYYELQRQTHIQVVPKGGELVVRTIKAHQLNVVPSDLDQEKGEIYILSSYDSDNYGYGNNMDETIGDYDDKEKGEERYIVWSPNYHFVMDGNGTILTEDIANPIAPVIPIVELAEDKDFKYWVQDKDETTDFAIEFNAALSSLGQIVNLQGYAQAFVSGPKEMLPTSMTVGPTKILRLENDALSGQKVEFGFASPSSDLAGAQAYIESLLSMFLSSQGVDPKSITGKADANNYSSGIERLLAMVSDFEASKDVMSLFTKTEKKIFEIIKAWNNLAANTNLLEKEYTVGIIPETASVDVKFTEPSSSITDTEILANIEKKLDLGLMSRSEAMQELRGIESNEADDLIEKIDNEGMTEQPSVNIMENVTNGEIQGNIQEQESQARRQS